MTNQEQAEFILSITEKQVFMALFNALSTGGLHNLNPLVLKAVYEQFARFNS